MSESIVHCVSTPYAMPDVVDPANWQDNRGGSNKNFFMNITRELARRGHRVSAFGNFARRVFLHDVEWCPIGEIDRHGAPDVLWACYDTMPIAGRHGMLRIGSHHTYKIDRCAWEFIDVNTAPSQAAVDELRRRYAPHSTWEVQPNAVEGDLLSWRPVSGRVLYHTSQDRGLRLLLKVWPEIRRRVPHATLHVIASLHDRSYRYPKGTEHFVDAIRLDELWENFDRAVEAGGVAHQQNVPRATVLRELQEASCFAFPVSTGYACETFSVSAMECCAMGIPVVMAPQDALESIYQGSVLLTPAPADQHLDEFADAVVQVLSDPVVAARLSERGKKLAAPFTYANAAKALSDIICRHTGFQPKAAVREVVVETPEAIAEAARPKVVKSGGKRIAFLLDPNDCGRPINPERILTDPRGLTGTDVTSFQLAVEMGRRGHDVTWFTNLTHDHEGRGIRFARYERWEQGEATERWDAAVATLSPRPLKFATQTGLRVINQQVGQFGSSAWKGWEQYVDVCTVLSETHRRALQRETEFDRWAYLPNGVDPSAFHEGDRDNRQLVWASSPDRGLHWLLEMWPRLRKAVPDVTLDVLYMYVASHANGRGENANRYRYMNAALEKLRGEGVRFRGSVSRGQVAEAMSSSRVLAYPCHPSGFTETFCCTVLEAAVAGCLPVIVGADALGEIYGEHVPCVAAPYPAHKQEYFGLLVRALTDDAWYFEQQAKAKTLVQTYNWRAVGDRLEAILGF